jgi:hypothetical protein
MDEQQYINLFFERMQNSIHTIPYMIKDIEKKFSRSFILQYYIGFYYEKVEEYEKAETKFKKSIMLEPLFMSPYLSLGSYYMKMQRYNDAEECLTKVFGKRMMDMMSLKRERKINAEDNFRVGSMLGFVYMNSGLKEKAERVYRKTKDILQEYCKDYTSPIYVEGIKVISLELGKIYSRIDVNRSFKSYYTGLNIKYHGNGNEKINKMIEELDRDLLEGCMLQMHYINTSEIDIKYDIKGMVERVYGRYVIPKFPDDHRNSKIHIGYISPDFNKNAVGLFITPLLKYFNRDCFEVFCYYTNNKSDEFTDVFRSYPNINWVETGMLDNSEIYNMMKFRHKLDILVDLIAAGHGGKLDLVAMSPANMIINYLGYPGTSGLEQMTHRLTDKVVDVSNDNRYVEKLIYMPRSFLCFHMFENINDVKIDYRGRADKKICIGVMNKLQKHHSSVRKIWKEILLENENVVLYLKRDEGNYMDLDELYKDFPRDRLVFLPFSNTLEGYLSQFNEVDFCVDTYPYSGTTTTCTSLYMGVPIFTVYNEKSDHVSNVTGSILKNMGMGEFIGGTLDEYKEKINEYIRGYIVNDNGKRQGLRDKFMDLMNPRQFMEEYEELLEKCVKKDISMKKNDYIII